MGGTDIFRLFSKIVTNYLLLKRLKTDEHEYLYDHTVSVTVYIQT